MVVEVDDLAQANDDDCDNMVVATSNSRMYHNILPFIRYTALPLPSLKGTSGLGTQLVSPSGRSHLDSPRVAAVEGCPWSSFAEAESAFAILGSSVRGTIPFQRRGFTGRFQSLVYPCNIIL